MRQHALTPAERGLKPASQLAADKPHGNRMRYIAGCRCDLCRKANADYERGRIEARKNGDWNGIVPASRARRHLNRLSRLGVGRRAVADATDIAETILVEIRSGKRRNILARTERLIMAVTAEAAADHALIPAADTWTLLNELIAAGFTRGHLALALGAKTPALQISKDQVTVRRAADVERLHRRLMASDEVLIDATRARGLIRELRLEWTPAARIVEALGPEVALEDGEVRLQQRIPRRLEKSVIELHAKTMGDDA
ncbi:hypothetical protein [Azonexus sp. R2A61]|uniref:hypothetical protein n=1 Tax=Azonexus sp. R2A61 TaxID=2744443 RepID=UPI001F45CDFB|nr:hypothetical protein [Azonexus sp. R2A61]